MFMYVIFIIQKKIIILTSLFDFFVISTLDILAKIGLKIILSSIFVDASRV